MAKTLAKSCFKDKKISRFLKDLSSAMSSSRHKAFSDTVTRPKLPFWRSLRLVSSSTGLPKLKVKRGLQIEGFLGWSPPSSLAVPVEEEFFCCPLPIRAFWAGGCWENWETSPSSAPLVPLPPWASSIFYRLRQRRRCVLRQGWMVESPLPQLERIS